MMVSESLRPLASVTRKCTVTVPGAVYVRSGVADDESSNAPSPSRSQAYVSVSPSGSLESRASKSTSSGDDAGLQASRSATAVGVPMLDEPRSRRIDPPSMST